MSFNTFCRTLHEAYQFLSWKYSRIRDITAAKNGDSKDRPSTSEGEEGKEVFPEAGFEDDECPELDLDLDLDEHPSRPRTAGGSGGRGSLNFSVNF